MLWRIERSDLSEASLACSQHLTNSSIVLVHRLSHTRNSVSPYSRYLSRIKNGQSVGICEVRGYKSLVNDSAIFSLVKWFLRLDRVNVDLHAFLPVQNA